MKRAIVFEASRDGYAIEQISPMTVGQLKNILEDYNDDTLFVLSHDNGYTFGSVGELSEWEATTDEDGDEEWTKVW